MGIEDDPKGHMANVPVGRNQDTGRVYFERRWVPAPVLADSEQPLFPDAEAQGLTLTPPAVDSASHYIAAVDAAKDKAEERNASDQTG